MANSAQPIKENFQRNLNDSKIHDVANDTQENASGLLENINSRGRRLLEDAQGRASEFYDLSSGWVQENRAVTMIGVAAVAGLLGFFIGRRGGNIDRTDV
jgi:ElaB/YqjD/DUF883 family membrane-anchored ribosome-binding protein